MAVIDPSGPILQGAEGDRRPSTARWCQVSTTRCVARTSPYDAVVSIPRGLLSNKAKVCCCIAEGGACQLALLRPDDPGRSGEAAAAESLGQCARFDKIISEVEKGTKVEPVKWNDQGDETISSGVVAMVVGFLFTFLIYMFVVGYGGQVMQSVIEEKANRIVELMVSSVKPFELMMGQVIGVMLVGLLQMAIWAILLVVILSVRVRLFRYQRHGHDVCCQSCRDAGGSGPAQCRGAGDACYAWQLAFGRTGHHVPAHVCRRLPPLSEFLRCRGSHHQTEQEDSSQFVIPVTMITLFGLYAAMYSVENTDGPLAFWTSVSLTSPIVMMVRTSPLACPCGRKR